MKSLLFTVTNELNYDQRMIRICSSLQAAGYDVLLVGREYADTPPLHPRPYKQKRLACFFRTGKRFYIEYNIRLFLYGLFKKFDLICAIDLDTILPCLLLSKVKRKKRVYDAHELFCEMKEIKTRPGIYKVWKWIERKTVPRFPKGYTVNEPIKNIFQNEYGVNYRVIRNVPLLTNFYESTTAEKYIIYQGAVNHGRSFETLIPAFSQIEYPLWIFGDGNFYEEAIRLTEQYNLQEKVIFKGKLLPEKLREVTQNALLGITLFENNGLSNYYSLANRFFDYIHARIPQVCVAYPVYKQLNEAYNVAVLVEELSPSTIAAAINSILKDPEKAMQLHKNCMRAREELNWQKEAMILIDFYNQLFL